MKSVRLFSVTFFLSLAILFSIGAILLFLPQDRKDTSSAVSVTSYYPKAEDNLSILAIGKEDGENNALFFTLLRFDAKNGKLTLIGLPRETEVSFGIETSALNRHYQQGGGGAAVRAVRQALRVSVDRYAVFDEDDLMVLADSLNGVEFDLADDMINDEITLRKGRQMLDGKRFRDAILFDTGYQLDMELTKALIEQRIKPLSEGAADQLVEKLLSLLDTNLSSYDYESRKSALQAWAAVSDNLHIFTLQGSYDEKQELFRLSQESVEQLRTEVYGLDG